MLWENFMISELKKKTEYEEGIYRNYFWRTYQQQEVDFILEFNNQMIAYEMKWDSTKKAKLSKTFQNLYPQATFQAIHKDNFFEFL